MAGLIKITFLGDMLCERPQISAVERAKSDYRLIFEQVKHLWADSDYVVGNLETPISGREYGLAYEKTRFNAPIEFGQAIKDSGISHVSIANNHALDRGEAGLLATIRNLDVIGLDHSGAYLDEALSEGFFEKEISGVKFAFLSCTYDFNKSQYDTKLPESRLWRLDLLKRPAKQIDTLSYRIKSALSGLIPKQIRGAVTSVLRRETLNVVKDSVRSDEFARPENQLFLDRITTKIKHAKAVSDIVVVLPHVGGQYAEEPGDWQKMMVDTLLAAGADIVVCNHAHIPQRIEKRGDVLIAYCLGNFCFSPTSATTANGHADYSVLLNCWIDPGSRSLVTQDYVLLKTEMRADRIAEVIPTGERWLDWRC